MFVEAGCEAERIGKGQPKARTASRRRSSDAALGQRRELERPQRERMGVFRVHGPQQRAGEALEQADHGASFIDRAGKLAHVPAKASPKSWSEADRGHAPVHGSPMPRRRLLECRGARAGLAVVIRL